MAWFVLASFFYIFSCVNSQYAFGDLLRAETSAILGTSANSDSHPAGDHVGQSKFIRSTYSYWYFYSRHENLRHHAYSIKRFIDSWLLHI